MPTKLDEASLETLLVAGFVASGWTQTDGAGYDPAFAVDLSQLRAFLGATQPQVLAALDHDNEGPTRLKALSRIQGEITRRGIVDVLRKGIDHGPKHIDLFFGTPSEGNQRAQELFDSNRFTIVRQLHFSADATKLSLDVCLFINGLPAVTFELKNSITKQTVDDAIEQYKNDRSPKEPIFGFGRTIVHMAVDDQEAWFCTKLAGEASWFLPFNKGVNDGAGNPVNPGGLKTSYLWEEVLTPAGITDILENFAHLVTVTDKKTGRKRQMQVFPRYHQRAVVNQLVADAGEHGAGRRYLVQHSAGSGKSNSIAWLTHKLVRLERGIGAGRTAAFDIVFVLTDRVILDGQIRDTIKSFAQVGSVVGHAEDSAKLREHIDSGKKVIITTIQKFPFILDTLAGDLASKRYAIVIDEAHSSQGGKASRAVSAALGLSAVEAALAATIDGQARTLDDEDTAEELESDPVQDLINTAMASRKMLPNASYFAFTATPKNKTLEMFGTPVVVDGVTKHRPFHSYTMKQAIQEGFILDVLKQYTPVKSYYRLIKTINTDPKYDAKRAQAKLRRYVEGHEQAISVKAEIMVDHFLEQVIATRKVGGQARAMVVTGSIRRALQYHAAISQYLDKLGGQYKAIVAFSGEHEFGGTPVTEATVNGFPSKDIPEMIQQDPYRFLVCADKFQTGYDEPLLHTMYVDKILSGIKAVQTLSRLNRAAPGKYDVFVLDFANDVDVIQASFADFYRTTILSEETDPNKLHDLKATLDDAEVYDQQQVDDFVQLYLSNADRQKLDPILDACVATYKDNLDEDDQVTFKGSAKAFTRTYDFLGSILPYTNADWEKLAIFLNFLVPKLPAPVEEDFSKGILQTIDMDSYRAERLAAIKVQLPDADAEIQPIPTGGAHLKPEPELDTLSNIIKAFNDLFGNIAWTDADRIARIVALDIPERVAADESYQLAAKNSDRQNARIEHDKALQRVLIDLIKDDTELFKQFSDNPLFKKWLADTVFGMTYREPA